MSMSAPLEPNLGRPDDGIPAADAGRGAPQPAPGFGTGGEEPGSGPGEAGKHADPPDDPPVDVDPRPESMEDGGRGPA